MCNDKHNESTISKRAQKNLTEKEIKPKGFYKTISIELKSASNKYKREKISMRSITWVDFNLSVLSLRSSDTTKTLLSPKITIIEKILPQGAPNKPRGT